MTKPPLQLLQKSRYPVSETEAWVRGADGWGLQVRGFRIRVIRLAEVERLTDGVPDEALPAPCPLPYTDSSGDQFDVRDGVLVRLNHDGVASTFGILWTADVLSLVAALRAARRAAPAV